MVYAPGTLETDQKKQNMALQQQASAIKTVTADTAANTADIATLQTDVATNTTNIATNTTNISKLQPKFARVVRSGSDQSISNGTLTKVSFDTVTVDGSSFWDSTNKRFIPTTAGYYRLAWTLYLSGDGATNTYSHAWYFNGSLLAYAAALTDVASQSYVSSGSDIAHFNGSTDYAEVFAYIAAGAGATFRKIIATHSYFTIQLVKAD